MKRLSLTLLAATVCLHAPLHANRDSIAVSPVVVAPSLLESARQASNQQELALGRVVDSLDLRLPQALSQTGRFTLVERQDIQPILAEQAFGQSGNVLPETAAASFRMLGAQYLVVLGLDDFQDVTETATFAAISRQIERRQVRVSGVARIYNTSTGVLRLAIPASSAVTETQQYFTEGQRQGDLTQNVYQEAATVMAGQIARKITDALYPARVLAKTGPQITINRGLGTGIEVGQIWLVFATGVELIDPDTGENLGQEEVLLGTAEIIRVTERTAQALLQEDHGVQTGQIIRPQ